MHCRIPDSDQRIPDPQTWIPDPDLWILDPHPWIPGSTLLDSGFLALDSGFQDSRFSGFRIPGFLYIGRDCRSQHQLAFRVKALRYRAHYRNLCIPVLFKPQCDYVDERRAYVERKFPAL